MDDQPSNFCAKCLCALGLLIAIPAATLYFSNENFKPSLWTFDWQAVGAIATAVAAGFSAWAVFAALRAARIALQIDQRVAERAFQRQQQDAIPLAHAIQRELFTLRGLCQTLNELPEQFQNLPPEDLLVYIKGMKTRFRARNLEQSVASLGCYDTKAGDALGKALSAIHALHDALDVPDDIPDGLAGHTLDGIRRTSGSTERLALRAARQLERYTGVSPDLPGDEPDRT